MKGGARAEGASEEVALVEAESEAVDSGVAARAAVASVQVVTAEAEKDLAARVAAASEVVAMEAAGLGAARVVQAAEERKAPSRPQKASCDLSQLRPSVRLQCTSL